MKRMSILTDCADYVSNHLKETYGLKGIKVTYGNLNEDGNIQVIVKSPKGDIEVGTIRLEYYALGGVFVSFFGDGIKNNQKLRTAVDILKQKAERTY